MVIVKLAGGLGNQMFQYAAARSLAWRLNEELKLDLSFLAKNRGGHTIREYELQHLNVPAVIAKPDEVTALTGRGKNVLQTALAHVRHLTGLARMNPNVYRERFFQFDPALQEVSADVYLDGYWQSERYFKEIAETIRREFTVRYDLTGMNRDLATIIKETNSVSLHVRRGDYVTNQEISQYHGVCEAEYYHACIDKLAGSLDNLYCFIFSDDPEWVRDKIRPRFPTYYVDHNGPGKGYEDLRLMSLCKHNVIANSSFSWWGAWLNTNAGKIVLAPRQWFNKPHIVTDDLIPASWVRVGE